MFQEVYELAKTTTLTMLISANQQAGTLTVCVKPTPRKGEEWALVHELSLTATPEEFEQSFPACLTTYATHHKSLEEQTAATAAVLEAAKQAQVAKGTKAATAAAKVSLPNPQAAPQPEGGASQAAAAEAQGSEAAKDEEEDDPFS